MASAVGDVQLNGRPYLIRTGGYRLSESSYSQRTAPNSAPGLDTGDHWSRWNQSDFIGMGQKDWIGDGPFSDGWGLDLSTPGEINVAKALAISKTDAANTGGYVTVTDSTTRLWFLGKTDNNAYQTTDGTNWTTAANTPAAGALATSKGYLKGTPYVACANGSLYSLSGTTWTEKTTKPLSTSASILGAFRSKLWVGYANALYNYSGTAWSTEQFAGLVDGTPICGAVGNTSLFFVTAGPDARVYQTDSNQLFHLGTLPGDFLPKAAVFLETLYIFGHSSDDTNTKGRVWRMENGGFVPVFFFGDTAKDYGIRSAEVDGATILWGANQYSGIGVFDPRMDIYQDTVMGFYVSSVINTVAGVVEGIAQFGGNWFCGIQGSGIYKQGTPGKYRFLTAKYDANSKNLNKLWGFGEFRVSKLLAGQTLTLKTSKDGGTTLDLWDTYNTAGNESIKIPAPAVDSTGQIPQGYRTPFIQMELTGTANGSAMTIYDAGLAYVEMADNPKRVWSLVLAIEGSQDEPQVMRDDSVNTRTATEMIAELNAMWNTKVAFEDMDGKNYTVLVKRPAASAQDIWKNVVDGSVSDLMVNYSMTLIEL